MAGHGKGGILQQWLKESHEDGLSLPWLVGLCQSSSTQPVISCDNEHKDKMNLHVQKDQKAS